MVRIPNRGFALRFSTLLLAVWQKVWFGVAKGMVLRCKTCGFAKQNRTFGVFMKLFSVCWVSALASGSSWRGHHGAREGLARARLTACHGAGYEK